MANTGSGLEIELWMAYLNKLEENKFSKRDKWEWYLAQIAREVAAKGSQRPELYKIRDYLLPFVSAKQKVKPIEEMTPEEIQAKKKDISRKALAMFKGITGAVQMTQLPEHVRLKTEKVNG